MEILIKSRREIEKMSKEGFPKRTAIVSITDKFDYPVCFESEPSLLLRVAFDDVDNDVFVDELGRTPTPDERIEIEDKYNMLTDEQAHEIASFYYNNRRRISTLICQCEHGQSRSAAVAAAILEFKERSGVYVFADDRYYPNKVVFRKVLEGLRDQIPVYEN